MKGHWRGKYSWKYGTSDKKFLINHPRDGGYFERTLKREVLLKCKDGTPDKKFLGNEGPLHSLSS